MPLAVGGFIPLVNDDLGAGGIAISTYIEIEIAVVLGSDGVAWTTGEGPGITPAGGKISRRGDGGAINRQRLAGGVVDDHYGAQRRNVRKRPGTRWSLAVLHGDVAEIIRIQVERLGGRAGSKGC